MELEVTKANNGGTLPYGAISKIVDGKKDTLVWLNKERVRNYLKKKKNEQKHDLVVLPDSTDAMSAAAPSLFDSQLDSPDGPAIFI